MPTSMHQTRMRSPSNLPIMEPHSACRSRIPTMVFAGSRFATLTATSCSSVDQGRRRGSDPGDIRSFGFLLFGLESPADPEHVAIRMAKVHLDGVATIQGFATPRAFDNRRSIRAIPAGRSQSV